MAERVALVLGATGVTGAPMCDELLGQGWRVVAVSRRPFKPMNPVAAGQLHVVEADLESPDGLRRSVEAGPFSHAFYCANARSPEARKAMIGHVLDAVDQVEGFRNIGFVQGMKYYGCHLGPFPTPALESDPRVEGCDFYYTEEDMIAERQRARAWTFTTLRPHSVCGYSPGNPLNLATALAIYGILRRERGQDFVFPGTEKAFDALFQVVDASLLARASIHVATRPDCANQAFNINNGDVFRWRRLWPSLASEFGLSAGGPSGMSLAAFFRENAELWRHISARDGLRPFPYDRLPDWIAGEYRQPNSRLACEHDLFADIVKLRLSGFDETIRSGPMFSRLFRDLRDRRVIP